MDSTFDEVDNETNGGAEPRGIPEGIGDNAGDHAPAAASDGTTDRPAGAPEAASEADLEGDSHVGIDGPGVPDTAQAAAGPTQAETSGSGPAPAAGQDVTHSGLTDSVAASEEVAQRPTYPEADGAPGANGGLSSAADPVSELAEDLGLEPGATDAMDPGQDNGLNS
jgi:hypothetical protein